MSEELCPHCNCLIPSHCDRCPHCGLPSRFPNVQAASDEEERNELEDRYRQAMQSADPRNRRAIQRFEETVAQKSRATITRPATEAFRLAASENELYGSFYELVKANVRLPSGNHWDVARETVDSLLFNYYKEHIRFAALSLNGRGLDNYGECHFVLKDRMIAHRATVFEENSIVFMDRHEVVVTKGPPRGYRATWPERGRLAVAKLARRVKEKDGPAEQQALGDFYQRIYQLACLYRPASALQ